MKHLLEFAKFKDLTQDRYSAQYTKKKSIINSYSIDYFGNYFGNREISIVLYFDTDYEVEIIYNLNEYTVTIKYFDEFILTEESQTKLLNYIVDDKDILDEIEYLIFKHAPDTSIEEFKELLKKPKIEIAER